MENADVAFTAMIVVSGWSPAEFTRIASHISRDLDCTFQEPRVSKSASLALDDAAAIVASAGAIFVAGRGKFEILF